MRSPAALSLLPRLVAPRLPWDSARGSLLPPAITVVAAVLLALVLRLPFFLESDFPLNDGGLFYVMSQDIAGARYALPRVTAYNGDDIPFAYPPLPFYLTTGLAQGLGVPVIAVVRWLPLAANLLTIVAFVAFARSVLRSPYAVLFAACAFAVLPRSYEWLVMGGGLTRSIGLWFAVLALAQAVALYKRPSAVRLLAAAVLIALTVLSHLEMGLFVAYSYALVFFVFSRGRRGVGVSLALTLAVALLTAPWWLAVAAYHGLGPYVAATTTAGWSGLEPWAAAVFDFVFPGQPQLLIVLGGLGVLGAIACVLRGEALIPLWLALIFALTPRSAATEATVPLAVLIGIGAADVIGPGLASAVRRQAGAATALLATPLMRALGRFDRRTLGLTAAATVLLGYAMLPFWLPANFGASALEALPDAERQSMAWIAEHTPPASAFVVLSPKTAWEVDYVLEWFPALAGRRSVLTPQGSEWLVSWTHARRVCLYNKFRAEALGSVQTMDDWLARMAVPYTHVYVSKAARGPIDLEELRHALAASPRYQVLLDDAGAAVFAREDTAAAPRPALEPPIASDCQTLFDQPRPVQADFYERHGERAPWVWLEEHSRDLTRRRRW